MRFFHFHELAAVSPGFPPSWLRQMACIYFTPRQPVDFSFLHYASPSLSIFFSLLPPLHAFPPRFSSLLPSLIVSSSFLLPFFVLHAPSNLLFHSLSLSCRPSRSFELEHGPHTAETTRRNRRREEAAQQRKNSVLLNGGDAKVRTEKDTTPLDKSRNGESSRMRRSVESRCQAGYKFQVKFWTKLKGPGNFILSVRYRVGRCHRRPRTKFRRSFFASIEREVQLSRYFN